MSSSDPSVIRVLDTLVTIAAGQYYNNIGQITQAADAAAPHEPKSPEGETVDEGVALDRAEGGDISLAEARHDT